VDIQREREDRFRFLEKLWEKTEGNELAGFNMWELGGELGLDYPTVDRIFRYLMGEGLIKGMDLGGNVSVTHRGVMEVERALSAPDEPTQYFPPVNVIQIQTMSNSVIQQGSPDAIQQASIDAVDSESLQKFIEELERRVGEMKLAAQAQQQLEADISTIKAQLAAPTPKRSIIKESLVSLRSILEGAAAAAIATPLVAKITQMLAGA